MSILVLRGLDWRFRSKLQTTRCLLDEKITSCLHFIYGSNRLFGTMNNIQQSVPNPGLPNEFTK
ncbi:hypothetical protein EON65_16255 [archaeon]|nr:MAG: hypothetical protein EON65_16255 [archaeon]